MAKEDEIKLIAYKLWEDEGRVNGRDREHWYQAETIWEQQHQEKAPVFNPGVEVKQPVKQIVPGKVTRKKSRRR